MKCVILKHTGLGAARRAIEATMRSEMASKATLDDIYTWMHSPIRTQIFEIRLFEIPSFVSTHLARHTAQHPQPFVTTSRIDRGGPQDAGRMTPVDMVIWANAEAIIEIAGQRLCAKASHETRQVVREVKLMMSIVDPELARHMVPNCVLQGGYCREPKPCGNFAVKRYNPEVIMKMISLPNKGEFWG